MKTNNVREYLLQIFGRAERGGMGTDSGERLRSEKESSVRDATHAERPAGSRSARNRRPNSR